MMREGIACAALLLAAAMQAGCSTHAWYESMRLAGENECRKQPSPAAVDDCIARLNRKSYDDYEKERARIGR